ncbi:hypothetical protein E2C01_068396 [Portunus trituberculatus]|uniref:Uncharacterized protein n=1 Tax=Portunus trituberculatus TaxID=210409 RepID=A0A5B7HMA3_PORTR|nr:hypothetical protein [Portunus trituberculatus]
MKPLSKYFTNGCSESLNSTQEEPEPRHNAAAAAAAAPGILREARRRVGEEGKVHMCLLVVSVGGWREILHCYHHYHYEHTNIEKRGGVRGKEEAGEMQEAVAKMFLAFITIIINIKRP